MDFPFLFTCVVGWFPTRPDATRSFLISPAHTDETFDFPMIRVSRVVSLEEVGCGHDSILSTDVSNACANPEETHIRREKELIPSSVIDKLPPILQTAVRLHLGPDFSVSTICHSNDACPPNDVLPSPAVQLMAPSCDQSGSSECAWIGSESAFPQEL